MRSPDDFSTSARRFAERNIYRPWIDAAVLILVGIDNIPARHGYTKRSQRMQNSNRPAMGRQHIRQATVCLGRFIQIAPAQRDVPLPQPPHHFVVPNEAVLADSLVTDSHKFSLRLR